VAGACAARRAGAVERIPHTSPRPQPRRIRAAAALLRRRGRLLAVQRSGEGLLGGLWELPGVALRARERPERALGQALRASVGLEVERFEAAGQVQHAFTHRRLQLHVFRGEAAPGRVRLSGYRAHRWVTSEHFRALPQARATHKALALALGERPS
jgi:A/G-specific adenine glycosylase